MSEATAPTIRARLSTASAPARATIPVRAAIPARAAARPAARPTARPATRPAASGAAAHSAAAPAAEPAARPLLGRSAAAPQTLGSELFDTALLLGLVAAVIAAVTLLVFVLHGWSA